MSSENQRYEFYMHMNIYIYININIDHKSQICFARWNQCWPLKLLVSRTASGWKGWKSYVIGDCLMSMVHRQENFLRGGARHSSHSSHSSSEANEGGAGCLSCVFRCMCMLQTHKSYRKSLVFFFDEWILQPTHIMHRCKNIFIYIYIYICEFGFFCLEVHERGESPMSLVTVWCPWFIAKRISCEAKSATAATAAEKPTKEVQDVCPAFSGACACCRCTSHTGNPLSLFSWWVNLSTHTCYA